MDGSNIYVIPKIMTYSINSLAVGMGDSRIYWTHAGENYVTSSDFLGKKRRIMQTPQMNGIQSIDIFDNDLFWIQAHPSGYSIWSADKISGENDTNHFIIPGDSNLTRKITIFDVENQPILRNNPCQISKQCTHFCVLSPTIQSPSYRCLCPTHILSPSPPKFVSCPENDLCQPDITTINENPAQQSDYLALSYGNTLAFTTANNLENFQGTLHLKRQQLTQVESITGMVYNSINHTIILTDSKNIFEYDVKSQNLQVVMEAGESKILSMAFDGLAGNLYWITGNGTVTIMSIFTRQKFDLLSDLGHLCDILVIPDKGFLLLAVKRPTGGILIKNYPLDGSPINTEFCIEQVSACITWAYDPTRYIFWSVPGQQQGLQAIQLNDDGTMQNSFWMFSQVNQSYIHSPSDIVVLRNATLWVNFDKLSFNMLSHANQKIASFYFLTEGEFCQAKLNSRPTIPQIILVNRAKVASPCFTSNCAHFCFPIDNSDHVKCACGPGYSLAPNRKTCLMNISKNSFPQDNITMTRKSLTFYQNNSKIFASDLKHNPKSEEATLLGISTTAMISAALFLITLTFVGGLLIFHYLKQLQFRMLPRRLSKKEIQNFFHGRKKASMNYEKLGYQEETWEIPMDSFVMRKK